jgi:thiol-disulfide isomerase/thioredoxin
VPGLEGRLKPRPNLLGWFKGTDLRDWSPEYDRDAKAFRLDDAKIQALRARGDKIQVFMYFGCWCPTCTLLMPRILSLDAALSKGAVAAAGGTITFDYYALPPVPAFYRDPEIVLREIQRIPTGIVYVNDQYAGRLVGTEWNRPEAALLGLLPK